MASHDSSPTAATEEAVRRWTPYDVAERTCTPQVTANRTLIPDMERAGVLVRRGRYWYGRAADIDTYLLGRWERRRVGGSR